MPSLYQTQPGEVGPYEALWRNLGDRYLPSLVAPVFKGVANKLDVLVHPLSSVIGIDTEAERQRKAYALMHGMHMTAATGAHTASALIENAAVAMGQGFDFSLGGIPSLVVGQPLAPPVEALTNPLQQIYAQQTDAAQELLGNNPSASELVFSGIVQAPLMVAEGAAAIGTMGPFGLAAVIANRASRDPFTGEYTGAYETAKGALIGAAMHAIGAGIARGGGGALKQGFKAAAGFGTLAAVEGANIDEITASAILGGTLQGGFAARNRPRPLDPSKFDWKDVGVKRDLDIAYNDWRIRAGKVGEHEYDVPLPPDYKGPVERPTRPGEGLAEGEAALAKPDPYNETGVRRRQDPDESAISRADTEPVVDQRYPSPTPSQVEQNIAAVRAADGVMAWTEGWRGARRTRFWNEERHFIPGEDAMVSMMKEIEMNGGPDAWALARSGGRSGTDPATTMEQIFAAAESNVYYQAGLSPREIVLRRQQNRGLTPEEIAAADTLLTFRKMEYNDAFARMKAGTADAGDVALAQNNLTAAGYSVVGATSEAGRTLGMATRRNQVLRFEAAKKLAVEKYGAERAEEIAEATLRLTDDSEMMAVLRMHDLVGQQGWGWDAASVWMAGLLSGPATWRTNLVSTAIHLGWHTLVEQPYEAMVGAAARPLRGIRRPSKGLWEEGDPRDRVYMQEVLSGLYGITQAGPFALYSVRKAWSTGEPFTVAGRVSESMIDMAAARKDFWPFRNLNAQDAGMKALSYAYKMWGQGMRDAIHTGVPIEHRFAHAGKFVRDVHNWPTDLPNAKKAEYAGYMRNGIEFADVIAFTRELNTIGKALSHTTNAHPVMKGFIPFLRSPANVTKEGFSRIPIIGALVAPKQRNALLMRETPTTTGTAIEQNAVIAKQLAAAGLAAGLWAQYWDGTLTGASPISPSEREIERSQGFQPYSRLETDFDGKQRYVSYARNEPLATPIAMIATMADWANRGKLSDDTTMGEWGEMIVTALAENIVNKSVLQSPARAAKAFSEPQRGFVPWFEGMVGSAVPALSNAAARARDIYRRDQTGLPEAMMARIPGAREKLPIMYDLVGRPYTTGAEDAPGLVRMFSEFSSQLRPHPVLTAMSLSGAQVSRVPLAITLRADDFYDPADPKLTVDSMLMRKQMRIDMTPHQREHVNHYANKRASDELRPFIEPMVAAALKSSEKFSIRDLQQRGMRPEALRALQAQGLQSATLWNAMRADIESTYTLWRREYRDRVIEQWRKEGRLRKELDQQLRTEGKGLIYRKAQQEILWE